MKLAIGVALVLFIGAATARADWFTGIKLPKAIDSPIVRKHVREDHKPGKKQRHPKLNVQLELGPSAVHA